MRLLSTTVILFLWTTKDHRTDATLPGMFIPLHKFAQKLLSTSSTPIKPTVPSPATQKYAKYHQNSINHQNHGFVKLHNLLEHSQQSTFASPGKHENWSGQHDTSRLPLQKFVLSEGQVAALATNHGTSQLSPSPQHHHYQHRPVPLTFPPSSPPPSDTYPKIISLPPLSPAHYQHLPQSSSHYTTSSLSYSFQNGYTTGYESPTPKKVVRHVSVFVAPQETPYNSGNGQKIHIHGNAEKHVNIIFIKGPDSSQSNLAEVNLPPLPEQKTLVYVLNKANDGAGQVVVNTPEPPKYSPPDVYFIKYKENQNGHQQQHQQYGVAPPSQEKSEQHAAPPPPQEKSVQQHYGSPPKVQQQPQYHHHQVTPSPPPEQHYNTPPPQHYYIPSTMKPQEQYNAPSQQQDNIIPDQYTLLLPPPLTTQQHQPAPEHGASSNQNFTYTYPSIINSTRVEQTIFSQRNLIRSNESSISADRRIEDVSDYDDHHRSYDFKYGISYHSLVSSEEDDNTVDVDGEQEESYGNPSMKTGNRLHPETPTPNSHFFLESESNKKPEDGRIKKKEGILSLLDAIFSTKANTPTLSSSPPIVKYNVGDRILAVKNGSNNEHISFGMGASARDVYPAGKNVKDGSTAIKSIGDISHDDPNLILLTRQNLTISRKDHVGTPVTNKEGDGGNDNSTKNGSNSKAGSSGYVPGRPRHFSPYEYAPTMGYNYFGMPTNKALIQRVQASDKREFGLWKEVGHNL